MNALNSFVHEKPTGRLYHYTTTSGMIGIIKSHKLWATDYRHLNDRKEYRIGAKLLKDAVRASNLDPQQREAFDALVDHTQRSCFVLSFSEKGDQLSQWRAYYPSGNGYALGFDKDNPVFASAKEHRFNLIRCQYDEHRHRELCQYLVSSFMDGIAMERAGGQAVDVSSRLKKLIEHYNWSLALALVISALKHSGFKEEAEWRLVSQYPDETLYGLSFRSGRLGITPYFELPIETKDRSRHIDEIIIGPTSNKVAAREALDLLLSKNKVPVRCIRLSKTPLRN